MRKKKHIVGHTAKELAAQRGESRSEWARAGALTPAEVEAAIASDPDEAGMVVDWDRVSIELPKPKADLHMRVDRDVLDWFKQHGKGYQTRINAVLRSYMARMRHE
jgi:uncharacterized protein (DUF4415 family)